MKFSAEHLQFLDNALRTQQRGTVFYVHEGQGMWVKKARAARPDWQFALLAGGMRLLGLGAFRPAPNPGGEATFAQELRRIAEFHRLGLRAPEVLAQTAQGLLLSDVGRFPEGRSSESLLEMLERRFPQDAAAGMALWCLGLDAVALVHERGSYQSQGFARNLVCCVDGAIAYVDFEGDPGEVLSLAQCQARDWLYYAESTALLVEAYGDMAAARQALQRQLARAQPDTRRELARMVARVGWLRRMPRSRRLGRDVQRVGAAARLLTGL